MAKGMLDLFRSPSQDLRQAELDDENQLAQLSRLDPFQAAAHASYAGARQAGRGLGSAVTAAAGRDPRSPTQKNAAAVQAAKDQVSKLGFDPDKPDSMDQFYRQVVQILQKQGLAAEALAVGQEYHEQKRKRQETDIKVDELERKKAADAVKARQADERNKLAQDRLGKEADPLLRLIDAWEETPIENKPRRDAIKARIDAMTEGKGVIVQDAGDRLVVMDRQGNEIRDIEKGESPDNPATRARREKEAKNAEPAYLEMKAEIQRVYDAAAKLHNHPGVDGITGRLGRFVGEPGTFGQTATTAASADARAALALHKQIEGARFLEGLNRLKQASATGSTGLGQVSNIEGEMVRNAAAALDRAQDAPSYRENLKKYIEVVAAFASRLDDAALRDGISPQPLKQVSLRAPGDAPKIDPKRTPKPPAAAAPAGGGDRVRVRFPPTAEHPNGQTGTIPRSQLEAAKRRGAVEVK